MEVGVVEYLRHSEAKQLFVNQALTYLYRACATLVKADNKLREQENRATVLAGTLELKVQIPATMPNTSGATTRKLRLNAMPPSLLAGVVEKADQYWLIWTFLKTLNIRPCGQDDPGVMWLELSAIFEMM